MVLLLNKSDVSDLMDMRQAIQCTETVYLEQAEGRVRPWPPFVVTDGTSELRVNAGFLPGLRVAGLRAGMGSGSQIFLYDTAEKRLVCVMAYPFSYVRVGATVGLAVDRLASADALHMIVIGTGRIARHCLEGILCLRAFERIQAYSRNPTNREEFCRTARVRFGINVEPVEELEPAVRSADVVVIATNGSGPVLRGAWLSESTHVSSAGIRHEIDDQTYLRANLVVVSSREQEQGFVAGKGTDNTLLRLNAQGRLNWHAIPELGEIVSGRVSRPQGISVFRESQGGFGDLIFANRIYEQAKAFGRGRMVNFSE